MTLGFILELLCLILFVVVVVVGVCVGWLGGESSAPGKEPTENSVSEAFSPK